MGEKEPQQLKFLVRQLHARAVRRDDVLGGIERERAAAQKRLRRFRTAAAQHGLDAGDELHHAEGLREVVVRAEVEPLDLIVLRALGGCHHDGELGKARARAQPAQQLDAVRAGEHHVEHDQLGRRFLLQGVPERVAVGEAPGLKAGGCERVHLDVADARIVLHAPDHPYPPL